MAATSEPPPGSVTAMAESFSPRQMAGMYFSLSASLPVWYRWGDAMSVWTPTAMASEPQRERPSSSQSTAVVRKSAPAPPYFSLSSTPRERNAEEAQLAHARPDGLRDLPGGLPRLDVGRDLLVHETPHRRPEHLMLFVEDLHACLPPHLHPLPRWGRG